MLKKTQSYTQIVFIYFMQIEPLYMIINQKLQRIKYFFLLNHFCFILLKAYQFVIG